MRIAAIDIGTNTILMLVADIKKNGAISIITDEHKIGRLGKGVDENGFIQKETFQRILKILAQFKNITDSLGVEHIAACGTSAIRDAANRQEFIEFVKDNLSIDIKILNGEEEAKLTYLGAVSEYLKATPAGEFTVLDIGGGSTELVSGTGSNILSAVSIDIGSVRLTERILKTSPPDDAAVRDAIEFVKTHISNLPPLEEVTMLIGAAGTLTTLAALDLRLNAFNEDLINRHLLKDENVRRIFQELRHLTLDQIISYPQIHPSRADIILAGILILKEILNKLKMSQITVSTRGLRYGILIKTGQKLLGT